jgi:hypothetical protein
LNREIIPNRRHGLSKTVAYSCWYGMIRRCHAPRQDSYIYYGARGVRVCDAWRSSFEAWWTWVTKLDGCPYDDRGDRTNRGISLDRIDNDGNYEPGNVRWATTKEQRNNRPYRRQK